MRDGTCVGRGKVSYHGALKLWKRFGKAGLLIDDAEEAGPMLARQLYGTESLPPWWLQAKSAACAVPLVEAALALPAQIRGGRMLVIVDRYIPPTCEESHAVALEGYGCGAGNGVCEPRSLGEILRELEKSCPVEYVSSFPQAQSSAGANSGESRFAWKPRTVETFHRIRNSPRTTPDLLKFGPQRGCQGSDHQPEREEWYLAEYWDETISRLASEFAKPEARRPPLILLTGAGASLPTPSLGPGVPPTWWIVEEAFRYLAHGVLAGAPPGVRPLGGLAARPPTRPPMKLNPCACKAEVPSDDGGKSTPASEDTSCELRRIGGLLQSSNFATLEKEDFALELLFAAPDGEAELLSGFKRAFRFVLQRFDHGFMFHHWLLAQMPWTAILTTNFDGFHERATHAASGSCEAMGKSPATLLRLGAAYPFVPIERAGGGRGRATGTLVEERTRTSRLPGQGLDRFALFKPYGNLVDPAALSMSMDDIESSAAFLRQAFAMASAGKKRRRPWLVVIGHSMRNDSLVDCIRETLDEDRFNAVWVDPKAHRRAGKATIGNLKWDRRFSSGLRQPVRYDRPFCIPLPLTAVAFAHDLWAEYRQRLQAP